MIITVNDLRNGEEAAKMFFLYLNTFSTVGTAFCNEMMFLGDDVKHNFTLLCVDWLNGLAGQSCYDGRNEASVMYARDAQRLLKDCVIPDRKSLKAEDLSTKYSFERENHAEAVRFMEYYLRHNTSNEAFVSAALREHKTLQQSFTRLCCKWFELAASQNGGKAYVRLAKKLNALNRSFPLI